MNTAEVAANMNLPQRTVAWWVSEGLLRPEGAGRGRRLPASWTEKDLRELRQLIRLRSAGVSMQALRDCMEYLREALGQNPASTGTFFVFGVGRRGPTSLVKVCEEGEAFELLRQGQGQMVLPVFVE